MGTSPSTAPNMETETPTAEPTVIVVDEGFQPLDQVTSLLMTYGWFVLIGGFLTFFAWRKWGQPRYEKWQDDKHAAQYHKDPDVALARMKAVEAARQRLQAEHDSLAAAHAEKMRQMEEQRRQEKIDEWENHVSGGVSRNSKKAAAVNARNEKASTSAPQKTGKPRLRNNDYNPLMGGGGSSGYRPATRSCFGSPSGGA